MRVNDQSSSTLGDSYPEENTCCLPPKAVARLGRGGVSDVATSPDGTLVAVASRLGVWLYDAHTDDFVALIAVEGTGVLEKIAFSPDGTRIAVADWDGKTTVWDVETGTMLNAVTLQAGAPVEVGEEQWVRTSKTHPPARHPQDKLSWMVTFSPDGKHLVGLDGDDALTLWDVGTGAKTRTLEKLIGYDAWITMFVGGIVIHASAESYMVFDVSVRGPDGIRLCKGTEDLAPVPPVTATTISPDGIETDEGRFPMWKLAIRTYCTLNGHTGAIHTIEFSDDGEFVGSRITDRLDPEDEERKALLSDHISYNMMWSSDIDISDYFFTDNNKIVKGWKAVLGETVDPIEDSPAREVAFSYDGTRFATATEGHVNVWGVKGWQNIATLDVRKVESLAFSRDGTRLATGGTWPEQTIRLWDVETESLIAEFSGHKSNVSSLAFSPDGRLLASGSFDSTILLWDMTPYLSNETQEVTERYVV